MDQFWWNWTADFSEKQNDANINSNTLSLLQHYKVLLQAVGKLVDLLVRPDTDPFDLLEYLSFFKKDDFMYF